MKDLPVHSVKLFSTKDHAGPSSSISAKENVSEDLEQKIYKLQQLQFEMQRKVGPHVNGHSLVQEPTLLLCQSGNKQCQQTSLFQYHQNLWQPMPLVLSCESPESGVGRSLGHAKNEIRRQPQPNYNRRKDGYPPFPDDCCFNESLQKEGFQRMGHTGNKIRMGHTGNTIRMGHTGNTIRGRSNSIHLNDSYPPFPNDCCFNESLQKEGFRRISSNCDEYNKIDKIEDVATCDILSKDDMDNNMGIGQHQNCSHTTELSSLQRCELSKSCDNDTSACKDTRLVRPCFFKNRIIGYSFAKEEHCAHNGSSNDITNNNDNNVFPRSTSSPDVPFEIFVPSNKNSTCGEEQFTNRTTSVDKPIKFQEVSYENMQEESTNDWTTREIHNLTHPFFEHQNARFFTVKIRSDRNGWYGTILMKALKQKVLYIKDRNDVDIFQREWNNNKGPLFVFVRHQPYYETTGGKWYNGGILQIITKLKKLHEDKYAGNMGCQVKLVSTAVIDCDKFPFSLKSSSRAREIYAEDAREYIRCLISKLREGCRDGCENLFQLPQYTPRKDQVNEKTSKQTDSSASRSHNPLQGEDWDLALNGM